MKPFFVFDVKPDEVAVCILHADGRIDPGWGARGPYSCATVRRDFWREWLKAKLAFPEISIATENLWPNGAQFLRAVESDNEAYRFDDPWWVHEIHSFMGAAGMWPISNPEAAGYPQNRSASPEQSARLLYTALKRIRDMQGNLSVHSAFQKHPERLPDDTEAIYSQL